MLVLVWYTFSKGRRFVCIFLNAFVMLVCLHFQMQGYKDVMFVCIFEMHGVCDLCVMELFERLIYSLKCMVSAYKRLRSLDLY